MKTKDLREQFVKKDFTINVQTEEKEPIDWKKYAEKLERFICNRLDWKDCQKEIPPLKDGWNHSKQYLVFYPVTESNTWSYGIAYYHANLPYFGKPRWIDFGHYDRQPSFYTELLERPDEVKD